MHKRQDSGKPARVGDTSGEPVTRPETPALLGLVIAMAIACSTPGPRAVQASSCREKGLAVIRSAPTCPEAVEALGRLVTADPDCAPFFADAGLDVACRGDGGAR
jgi:hypothetical protein